MKRFLSLFVIILSVVTLSVGCSGNRNPATPSIENPGGFSKTGLSGFGESSVNIAALNLTVDNNGWEMINPVEGHDIWGIVRVRLYDDGRMEIIPRRTVEAHFNITSIILNCPACIDITLGPPPGPGLFDFNITLTNPFAITGYDVTGVVRWSGDIKFLNPDSYTYLFSYPGDNTPNPYATWNTGVGNNTFPGGGSFTETLRFQKGGLTKWMEIDYLFQASYPSNQQEPYGIWALTSLNNLQSNGSNTTDLRCRVGDWQGNMDSVTVDLSALGGSANAPMSFFEDNIWELKNVSYSPTGQGIGIHRMLVKATSAGVSTYNYLPVTVVQSFPITDGSFLVQYQNKPLIAPDGPTDGMDIAVIGGGDGTSRTMVFGHDDTFHFWNSDLSDGSFGLYYGDSGLPVKPFDLPVSRFDFADAVIPDTSVNSIFKMSWGESNTSTQILDGSSIPSVKASDRVTLWDLNDGNLILTGNVLVLGSKPGPPVTFDVIVKPIEFASGLKGDGMLFLAMAFSAGNETLFPYVDIMAWHPPLDFSSNTTMISDGYEILLDEGSGPGVVNRDALVGIDVDDSQIVKLTGGFAGHARVVVVEGGSENDLEIIDADIDSGNNVFVTIELPSPPLDVEILPQSETGFPANWIAVLCQDGKIRLYNYFGTLVQTIGGPPYMIGTPLRLDIDDANYAIHVLHQGPSAPLVTVYKWNM